MKKDIGFVISIFEIVIGETAVISFIILLLNKVAMLKWIPALILAIVIIIIGIKGIIKYCN